MVWLTVLALPDGSRVETSMPSGDPAVAGLAEGAYRLHRADGSVSEFPTLTSILGHLSDRYDPDDLGRASRTLVHTGATSSLER